MKLTVFSIYPDEEQNVRVTLCRKGTARWAEQRRNEQKGASLHNPIVKTLTYKRRKGSLLPLFSMKLPFPFLVQWILSSEPLCFFPHLSRELKSIIYVTPCYSAAFNKPVSQKQSVVSWWRHLKADCLFPIPVLRLPLRGTLSCLFQGIWRDSLSDGMRATSHRMSFLWDVAATLMPYAFLFHDTCLHSVSQEKDYFHSRMGNHRAFTGRQCCICSGIRNSSESIWQFILSESV